MDVKKINAPASTVTRDLDKLDKETGSRLFKELVQEVKGTYKA